MSRNAGIPVTLWLEEKLLEHVGKLASQEGITRSSWLIKAVRNAASQAPYELLFEYASELYRIRKLGDLKDVLLAQDAKTRRRLKEDLKTRYG